MLGVKLWGGLGNQMFQYAFGLYLAQKRNEKASFFADNEVITLDTLAINCFAVELNVLNDKERQELGLDYSNVLIYRLKRKCLQWFPFLNSTKLVEKDLVYLPSISDKTKVFDGYWQSFNYLLPIENELRKQFAFKNQDQLIKNSNVLNNVKNNNSISLHIRKGDYLVGANAKIFESCPMEYYYKGIEIMRSRIDVSVFYVFSNDIDWAKNNLKIPEGTAVQFVDNSDSDDPACADLFLMSLCKHHIIANSTFSWWGAWLNPSSDKIVIAPHKWYVGKRNDTTKDLIPQNWIKI